MVPSSLSPPLSAPAALPAPVIDVPGPLTSLTITQANSELGNTPSSPDLDSTTTDNKNVHGSCAKSKPGVADTKNTTEPIENTTEPLADTEITTEPLAD